MGMLKNLWNDTHIDQYSKYQFFLAMPLNLLLWGCESWAIKESSYANLDVFLHYSIRRILGIKMAEVKDERITNKMVRENFYNIQDIRSIVAARVLLFIGKVIRTDDESSMPKQLLTS